MTLNENNESTSNYSKRKIWLIGLTIGFFIIGLLSFSYWFFVLQFYETTDDAYVSGNLVAVMPRISGHVTKILADETDFVTKDQPLVTLDTLDASIALKNAESQLALTVREVNKLYKNVDQLQSNVQVAKDNYQKTEEDLNRRKGLKVNKTITEEDLQHAKIAFNSAKNSLALAKNELAGALAIVGNTDLYNHPQIKQAAINVRNAYLTWQRTTIYAPATGYIAKRSVQVGQQATPSTILMVIVPLNQVWVTANFKESQLKNIRIDQPVELTADAYGNDVVFSGKVVGLSPGAGNVFALLPPQNATGNWIKIVQRLPVRISIDAKQLEHYPLRIGLSMLVSVNTHNRSGRTLAKLPQDKIVYQTTDVSSESIGKADEIINKIIRENAENIEAPKVSNEANPV